MEGSGTACSPEGLSSGCTQASDRWLSQEEARNGDICLADGTAQLDRAGCTQTVYNAYGASFAEECDHPLSSAFSAGGVG